MSAILARSLDDDKCGFGLRAERGLGDTCQQEFRSQVRTFEFVECPQIVTPDPGAAPVRASWKPAPRNSSRRPMMAEKITQRNADYARWYLDVVSQAGLAE